MPDDLTPNNQEADVDVSDEQFAQIGQRIAYLLAAARLTEEEKEAWIDLVPEMSLEQMDQFAKALEANIAGAEAPEFERLEAGLQQAKAQQQTQANAITQKATASLEEIERMLSQT